MKSIVVLRRKTLAIVFACLATLFALPVFAQTTEAPAISFTGDIGAGVSLPVYSTGRNMDTGWNVKGGAGVMFGRHAGVVGEFMYSRFDVTQTALTRLNFPNGDMDFWGLTVNPMIRLNREDSRYDAYLIGGGGLYYRNIDFTAPTVSTFTAFDPFFGLFVPVAIPANEILRSHTVLKGGLNIGGGIGVKVGDTRKGSVYVETRYHHMYTRPNATTVLPVTFGFRW
ncbi:MAG: outer membrane beta-barrel protein [Acidobacteria bacterium]|nr:outer membrane beta-barrel protein [Acidobacteriota bacterium]